MKTVNGIVEVAGQKFSMSGKRGYGLINLFDKLTLITFTCPFETMPPKGAGNIVGQSFKLDVVNGELFYNNEVVHTEVK
jgi:hypothetical protein